MRLSWISLVLFAAAAAASWPATAQSTGLQAQQACLARHNGALVPGRLTDRGCNIAWEDIEVAATSYEPLAMDGRWGRPHPDGASQQVGNEPRGPTGLCRALHEGAVMPGKYHGGECLVGFRGRVLSAPVFEVLLSGGSGGIGGTLAGGSAGGGAGGGVPPPVSQETCAREGGACTVRGHRIVAYGAGDRYLARAVQGRIDCSNARFGDPAPGQAKQCVVGRHEVGGGSADGVPVGDAWRACADEGGECRLSGPHTMRYGAAGRYLYKVADGSQRCSNDAFGRDPAPNARKQCAVQEPVPLGVALAAAGGQGGPGVGSGYGGGYGGGQGAGDLGWSRCGDERAGGCRWSPPGARLVRYGEGDRWFLRLATGSQLECRNDAHGDPSPGRGKACEAGSHRGLDVSGLELVGRWRHCANENGSCQVGDGPRLVRYGSADAWSARLVTGTQACSNAGFQGDPAPNRPKLCEVEEPLSRAETDRAREGRFAGLQRQPVLGGSVGVIRLGAPR
ncbi:MAG: hypothetical protein ACKVQR_02040 [Aquabacterium sp.]